MTANQQLQMPLVSTAINRPIQSVTQLYWDGCLYNRNKNSNSTKVNKTYHFYCKGCNASLILKIQPNQTLSVELGRKTQHRPNCQVQVATKSELDVRLLELKEQDFRKWRESGDILLLANPIPVQFAKYKGVYKWLHKVDFDDENTMLIFYTAISMANTTPRLLLDGTFKTTPVQFAQVFNGCGLDTNSLRYFPIFHVLIQKADKLTYSRCLYHIIQKLHFRQLDTVLFDFEMALMQAIEFVIKVNFLNVHLQGCFFYYLKAVREKFNDNERRRAYFSPKLIILIEYLNEKTQLKEFVVYWERTWSFNGLFPPKYWNASTKLDKNFIGNDGIEQTRRTMFESLGIHPSMNNFCELLCEVDQTLQNQVSLNDERELTDYGHS